MRTLLVFFKTGGLRVTPSPVGSTPTRFRHCFSFVYPGSPSVVEPLIGEPESRCCDKSDALIGWNLSGPGFLALGQRG